MLTAQVRKYYQKFRNTGGIVGEDAKRALINAKMQILWDKLEVAGLVRFEVISDDSPDLSYLEQKEFYSIRNREYERANNQGMWGICGQYRTDTDGKWENGDSVWGFIGSDWDGSGYDVDVKAGTIKALRDTLKGRCPCCRK